MEIIIILLLSINGYIGLDNLNSINIPNNSFDNDLVSSFIATTPSDWNSISQNSQILIVNKLSNIHGIDPDDINGNNYLAINNIGKGIFTELNDFIIGEKYKLSIKIQSHILTQNKHKILIKLINFVNTHEEIIWNENVNELTTINAFFLLIH